jgi:hypothetical protein
VAAGRFLCVLKLSRGLSLTEKLPWKAPNFMNHPLAGDFREREILEPMSLREGT